MSKLTPELSRRFASARRWFTENDGHETRRDLTHGYELHLMARSVGSGGHIHDEVPGDYEELFVQCVGDIQEKLRGA